MKAVHDLATHDFWVGATGRKIRAQIRDDDGNIVDMTGKTAVISATLGSTYKIQAQDMTIEVGTDGWVNYTPAAGEVNADGQYMSQIRITEGGLHDFTDQFILNVENPIHYVAP